MTTLRESLWKKNIQIVFEPYIPDYPPTNNCRILHLHRLTRMYDSNSIKSAEVFIEKVIKAKETGWKIFWTIHSFVPLGNEGSQTDFWVLDNLIKLCDTVFTHNKTMKNSVSKRYKEKIKVIHHGSGIHDLEYLNTTSLNISEVDKPLVSLVGNIRRYKNLDLLYKIFKETKNLNLLIAGPVHSDMKNLAKKISENDNVILIDKFIDKSNWELISQLSDAFIQPYNLNTPGFKIAFYPSSLITMGLFGLPIITPKCDSTLEILGGENNGYFYENEEDLREKIIAAVNNNDSKMVDRVKNHILMSNDWNRVSDIINFHYKQTLR